MCDFGINGRISDGGVIEHSLFYRKLKDRTLSIPSPRRQVGGKEALPFVFIGDEAFSLRSDFLKPFSQRELDHDKKIFNYRLSRARCRVENSFGILSTRFRIFHTAISINLNAIDKVVIASCVLHNFLRRRYATTYASDNNLYRENLEDGSVELGLQANQMTSLQRGYNRRANKDAQEVRQLFMNYFNSEGAIPWQERMIS